MPKKTKPANKPEAAKPGNGNGALAELKELYKFMTEGGLQALELDRKDLRVRLVRKSNPAVHVAVPVYAGAAFGAPAGAAPSGHAPAAPAAPAGAPANVLIVKSPMMGVFYRAASPSSPPFAKEGDTVKPGDVLCLIEAMKVFNDVKSEVSGKIVKVLLDNGKPVKVGQDIYWVERA
ncbi:MAG: acetyl-CoA carboxylase biotin carboxyl carrier protein [Elusimicrobia bacterium]|nr:acetyl-CoA carboxylase biotin carboxyl carrier protein [Elusimicrobiota bacterium]